MSEARDKPESPVDLGAVRRRIDEVDRQIQALISERARFAQQEMAALGSDVDGNPVFLARNRPHLELTVERWPDVGFHATREHGEVWPSA